MAELKVKIEPEDIVDRVLDTIFKGRTLREWGDALTQPKTRADRIRAMSDEELAEWYSHLAPCCHCEAVPEERNQVIHPHNCYEKWLDWLRSEAKEEHDGRKNI